MEIERHRSVSRKVSLDLKKKRRPPHPTKRTAAVVSPRRLTTLDIRIIYEFFRAGKLQRTRQLANYEQFAMMLCGETCPREILPLDWPEARTSPKRWFNTGTATTAGVDSSPDDRDVILGFNGPQVSRGRSFEPRMPAATRRGTTSRSSQGRPPSPPSTGLAEQTRPSLARTHRSNRPALAVRGRPDSWKRVSVGRAPREPVGRRGTF